jgi:fatty-acyl-CoA synthase
MSDQQSALTYVDRIMAELEAGGHRDAIVSGATRITCTQAHSLVLRMAGALRQAGLNQGDAVALACGNTAEVLLLQLAIHLIGCRLVFVPAEPIPRERIDFIKRAEPDALVIDQLFGQGTELARLTQPRLVFSLGPAEEGHDLLALAARTPAVWPIDRAAPEDIISIFYTGGTTGRPKMVLHRHSYYEALVFAAARRNAQSAEMRRVLICTTVNHGSGQLTAIIVLLGGGTIVVMDRFDAGEAIAAMLRERITSVMVHPAMLYGLLDHPDFPANGFPDLIRLHYGGACTAPARVREAIERFGPVLRQTYGLTEVSLVTLMEPDEHDLAVPYRLASCGKALPGMTEVVVVDEDNAPVAAGEVGEVCVRSVLVMAEYWKDEEITRQAIRDGWFHTGDLGYLDQDGYLYLVDRIKDVIYTGSPAANVYSKLLEDVLLSQPGVRAAAVIGMPDERYGEAVHAVVVADPGVPVDVADLKEKAVDELGPLYEPQSIVFADSLPWTRVGKVDKKALRATLAGAATARSA